MARVVILVVLVMVFSAGGFAEDTLSTGLKASPEAYFPVGSRAESYSFGLGGRIQGLMDIPAAGSITPAAEVGYAFIPLDLDEGGFAASTNLTVMRAGLGAQTSLPFGERLSLFARAYAGGFYAELNGNTSGDATGIAYGAGVGAGFLLSSDLQMELNLGYDSCHDLYDGIALSLGTTLRLGGPGSAAIPRADFAPAGAASVEDYIRFTSVSLDRVFPVLYKYYDDHPIGSATIVNEGPCAIENLEVSLSMQQFMDAPKLSARVERFVPGEEQEIDIYALFTEEILSVTEGAKVAAELNAGYKVSGRSGNDSEVITLETYDRNALQWDDDRKIAAFVTARDEEIQRFARNIASIIDDQGIPAIGRDLQLAMALFTALQQHRCSYVIDPSSPYAELSDNSDAVDTVQFPRQTLQYRAGDCDDLSSTYAALLEAVGVSTAFITVPGHIYTAFCLEMDVSEAFRTFSRSGELIRRDDGSVWVPVETTLLKEGFLAAWTEGARQWREHEPEGRAGLFTTSEAWRRYEPVAFGVSDYQVDIPLRSAVARVFHEELDRFIKREIIVREGELKGHLRSNPGNVRALNSLGVLYARYGRYDAAEEQFRAATRQRSNYVPALVNLGNLAYLREEYGAARRSYRRVLEVDPDNRTALLGMARVEYAAEDYNSAEKIHSRLSRVSPDLAQRFSYLASGAAGSAAGRSGRAGSIATDFGTLVVWEE